MSGVTARLWDKLVAPGTGFITDADYVRLSQGTQAEQDPSAAQQEWTQAFEDVIRLDQGQFHRSLLTVASMYCDQGTPQELDNFLDELAFLPPQIMAMAWVRGVGKAARNCPAELAQALYVEEGTGWDVQRASPGLSALHPPPGDEPDSLGQALEAAATVLEEAVEAAEVGRETETATCEDILAQQLAPVAIDEAKRAELKTVSHSAVDGTSIRECNRLLLQALVFNTLDCHRASGWDPQGNELKQGIVDAITQSSSCGDRWTLVGEQLSAVLYKMQDALRTVKPSQLHSLAKQSIEQRNEVIVEREQEKPGAIEAQDPTSSQLSVERLVQSLHGLALANQSQKQADEVCAQQQEFFWMDPSLASQYSELLAARRRFFDSARRTRNAMQECSLEHQVSKNLSVSISQAQAEVADMQRELKRQQEEVRLLEADPQPEPEEETPATPEQAVCKKSKAHHNTRRPQTAGHPPRHVESKHRPHTAVQPNQSHTHESFVSSKGSESEIHLRQRRPSSYLPFTCGGTSSRPASAHLLHPQSGKMPIRFSDDGELVLRPSGYRPGTVSIEDAYRLCPTMKQKRITSAQRRAELSKQRDTSQSKKPWIDGIPEQIQPPKLDLIKLGRVSTPEK